LQKKFSKLWCYYEMHYLKYACREGKPRHANISPHIVNALSNHLSNVNITWSTLEINEEARTC